MSSQKLRNSTLKTIFFERKHLLYKNESFDYKYSDLSVALLDLIPILVSESLELRLTINTKGQKVLNVCSINDKDKKIFSFILPKSFCVEIYPRPISIPVSASGKINLFFLPLNTTIIGPVSLYLHPLNFSVTKMNSMVKNALQLYSLLSQKIETASKGIITKIILKGTGYRGEILNTNPETLFIRLGASQPYSLIIPNKITVLFSKPNTFTIFGYDRQLVNQFAATIRKIRTPNVYTGSGVFINDEFVKRKVGKKKT